MWGDCDKPADGYVMSVAIPASKYAGETVRTYTCAEHGDWYIARHPEQVIIPLN